MTDKHVPGKFHPGEYLVEELKARGITLMQFASDCAVLGLSFSYIMDILCQRKKITRPIAVAFEILLGSDAETWMNLQKEYDR